MHTLVCIVLFGEDMAERPGAVSQNEAHLRMLGDGLGYFMRQAVDRRRLGSARHIFVRDQRASQFQELK